MNDEKFKHLLSSLEEVDNYDDYTDILNQNKLSHYGQLQSAQDRMLEKLIQKRFNVKSKDVDSSNIQELVKKIVNEDYPHLNVSGTPELKGKLVKGAGGYFDPNTFDIGVGKDAESRLSTLGHEIGHANDEAYTKLNKDKKLRSMLMNNTDPEAQKLLQDLKNQPIYDTRSDALDYDSEKRREHNKILREANIDPSLKDEIKSGIKYSGKDYDKYELNKKISDLVPDNEVINTAADRHHLPRLDEVDGDFKLDKGNWEDRNIKRLFAGKGLKSLAGALPLIGAASAVASIADGNASELVGVEGIGQGSELGPKEFNEMDLKRKAIENLRNK